MEPSGQWRKCTTLLLHCVVFNIACSREASSGDRVNVSSDRQFADIVSGQHMFPSWYDTSSTVKLHSNNRWRTQMAFSKTVYSFEVEEDTAPGTVVGTVQTVSATPTPITYSVQEDDGDNLFLLSPLSGDFLLSRSLDFEAQSFYILTVAALRGNFQVSSVRVYFNVLDVNDNPPVFSQVTFSASVPEDTRVGTCFLSLNVSDKDDGENGDINVSVTGGDEEEVFIIGPSGSLCLNTELDREKQSFYNLTVTANDCARPASLRFTSTAHVKVLVDDVNDNAPVFEPTKTASIPEDAELKSVVTIVHAEDKDDGSNGDVSYHLTPGGVFSIDNRRGEIYLEQALDREQEDTLTITVTASDGGSPRKTTALNLTVHVEDVNDHDPVFTQNSYSLTVREDINKGTSLFRAQALDKDIGRNGQVRYIMTQTCPFVVDTVRGVIIVMDKLDREKEKKYDLVVTAEDLGDPPRSATAAVTITVSDVNDFAPVFSPETLTLHVTENEDNHSSLTPQVSALDEDLGINSQLRYFIERGNSHGLFSITPSGTFQITHSLDREVLPSYFLTVIAVDSGLPPLTGTLTINVIVDDVNDNHPEFTEEAYNTIVYEDSPAHTVFAIITASDIDEGMSGEIRYSLENTDTPFAIDETSGELFTTDVLDRETVAVYRLIVIASDKYPAQPLSSSVLVTVIIGDINDHRPQFMNSPYVAYVPTELASGAVVCAVRATDGDSDMNAKLHYSLYGQMSDLFSIHPESGTVFASRNIRRTADIVLNVHVEDAGETPKSDITTISIRFEDATEFPKMNVHVWSYSFSEDEPVGTLVAVVSASSTRAEPVSFYLASGNFEEVFHVDQLTGALTVENPLDYENKKGFDLLIEARDASLPPFSSFKEIHINISDVNDNYPLFTQSEYRCEVLENSSPSWVCDVLAFDADSESYAIVQYNITEGNNDNFFTVDPDNGLLSTTASLDREITPEFNLTVEAAELYNPLHKDKATVIVVVLDRNDNMPRFTQIFFTEVPENSPVGRTVLQITSTDDDIGTNAVINYFITNPNDNIPFTIDIISGYVTVKRPLDREIEGHYILKVNANDSAWSISTDVTIIITDINDNAPVFSDDFYAVGLTETKEVEVFVLQVLAKDADLGQNAEIVYFIEPANPEFWVNSSSGEIYTKQPLMLHSSSLEIYQFQVIAFDCGSNPLSTNVTVTVRLEPFNYYPPVFLPFPSLIALPYDMAIGTVVVQFTATDQDTNDSSTGVEFFMNGETASEFFRIQSDNGKVILYQSLVENINSSFTSLVTAKDQGFPSLSSRAEITFIITDRNQFPPSFREPDVTFYVPEDLMVGSVIGRIQAEDKDNGPNGAITYCITPENPYLPFSVGKGSGLLTLTGQLDFENGAVYHLPIKSMDGGWFSEMSMLNVTVVVLDVNDNAPVFLSSVHTTSVPENSKIGTNILQVRATDSDSAPNAQISYSLIAGNLDKFEIDPIQGTITTLELFDYEQEQTFNVTAKASNVGVPTLFSTAQVVIKILDVNEFTPTFTEKQYNFSVFKNVPIGTVIGKVTATDGDRGSAGQVSYLMFGQNKNKAFEINKISGEICTRGNLREQGNSLTELKVLAKNPGTITGVDIDETVVHVSVIDMNDAPTFTSALYLGNVSENSPAGTSVITVSVPDQDYILDLTDFLFSITDGNTNFSFAIHPYSGVISVNSHLDRELLPLYNLTVTVTENGSPPSTGTANVIVTVDDVNDSAPRLTLTKVQVRENQPQGTIVYKLMASDSDLPPNQGPFTFWLVNPPTDNAFSMSSDGVLSTTRAVDREQTSVYQLLVAVSDAGIPSLSSTTMIEIKIVDENDNPPLPRNIVIEVKYFGVSFPGGMIGNVHPEDQDESDTFNCTIKSGSLNMFTIANGTCELWSSPFQGEATFNITLEATDNLHYPVNNSIYVNYKGFTNSSIDSCILFYVKSSSMEEFLSYKYLRFVKGLDSLFNLQASKTHVFGIKRIGSEILLLAAVKNYNGQYLSKEVASGISAGHAKLLETYSNVTISHITSDPCLASPCRNGATCNKNIYISRDVAVLESTVVIFVSPQKQIFNCSCPPGFTGTLCEDDINECEVNPCENEGTCVNTPGGFYCQCLSGFSGSVCSTDTDVCLKLLCRNGGSCVATPDGSYCQCVPGFEGETCDQPIDFCGSTPCVQGRCINSQKGFSCSCPFGISGVHCEEHGYGFEELSFAEFPPLDRRANLISLEFATVQRNSLLLYNPGGPSSREFFALEIVDGALHLSYDLGSGPVRLQTNKQVADGNFHTVIVRRIGNMASLQVDSCTDVENEGFCFSQSDGETSERTLDVWCNMTFGGLRDFESILLHPTQLRTHDFVGCVRNLHVNGLLLTPLMALAAYNILDRCPRDVPSPCHSNPCQNGARCHDHWSDYFCECRDPFMGRTCTKELSEELVLHFNGNDYIEYVVKERFKRDHLLKDLTIDDRKGENSREETAINFKFKTRDDGVLVFVAGQTGSTMLTIKDGKLLYISKDTDSGRWSEITVDSTVADGAWHILLLSSKGRNNFLHLDGELALNISDRSMNFTPVNVRRIIFGAFLTGDSTNQYSGFIGCLQHFNMAGYTLPFSGHNLMVGVLLSPTLVHSSCSSPGVCFPSLCSEQYACFSAHCQHQRRCGSDVPNSSCICLHNVSDHTCDICTSASHQCSEAQYSAPLWVMAVIIPLISILVLIGMCVAFCRMRRHNAQCQNDRSPQRREHGEDNMAFCLDDNRKRTDAASAGHGEQHNLMGTDWQRSSVEYYEIGSVSSASFIYPDSASLQLTWHKHLHSATPLKDEPKRWGDVKLILAGLRKEYLMEEKTKSLVKPQNVAKTDPEESQQPTGGSCKQKCFPQAEFLEPVQSLTCEEISKLNIPLVQSMSDCTPHHTKSTSVISFLSATTEAESECEPSRNFTHEHVSPSGPSFRQRGVFLQHTSQSAAGQHKAQSDPSSTFEQWENILNMQLPFSSYAPVFEDIACLATEPRQGYDMQSDTEEVI